MGAKKVLVLVLVVVLYGVTYAWPLACTPLIFLPYFGGALTSTASLCITNHLSMSKNSIVRSAI